MSIRLSQGGRIFGIIAGLGGAAMIGSAFITWTKAVFVMHDLSREISEQRGAERLAILVLGLLVVVGAAGFITVGSRRLRTAAGALVVLWAIVGLAIALLSVPPSPSELPCTNPGPICTEPVVESGDGPALATWGAVVAAGFGILALLRSGGEASPIPEHERTVAGPSTADRTEPGPTRHRPRMSDAALLAWIVVATVIAVIVGFFIVAAIICSDPSEWC